MAIEDDDDDEETYEPMNPEELEQPADEEDHYTLVTPFASLLFKPFNSYVHLLFSGGSQKHPVLFLASLNALCLPNASVIPSNQCPLPGTSVESLHLFLHVPESPCQFQVMFNRVYMTDVLGRLLVEKKIYSGLLALK